MARALRVHYCSSRIIPRETSSVAIDLSLDDIHRCSSPLVLHVRNVMCPRSSSRVGVEWRPGERNPRRRTSARAAPLPASKAQCFLYSRPANHGRDLRALLVLSRLRNSRVLDVPGRRLDRPYYCSSALGGGLSPGASPLQALLAAVRTRLTSCTEGGPRISTTRTCGALSSGGLPPPPNRPQSPSCGGQIAANHLPP